MKKFISKLVEKMEISEILCNWCGSGIEIGDKYSAEEYLEIEKEWCYHSDFDGQTHSFHICSDCYKKMIDQFKIKPDGME